MSRSTASSGVGGFARLTVGVTPRYVMDGAPVYDAADVEAVRDRLQVRDPDPAAAVDAGVPDAAALTGEAS